MLVALRTNQYENLQDVHQSLQKPQISDHTDYDNIAGDAGVIEEGSATLRVAPQYCQQ
jgi:hypothetical protein